ncbi:cyclin-dependent kinase inhibitor 3 isoform X2 [Lingula anatina]|uniref:Cyclin-dependent kinase inhibitor 3 n=1 Tax=Lingula anatina TaxID=7574 RepID=A0A1S3IEM4_LINAN|nr:cyclin-dependent kinase inhibitor 3 isoform X2 [Lingula anatina]|eukprot:XP_013396306.1 cyclin-dependent kinase inhibitor 3 isoform X2 [Lingula anatina]
MVLLRFREVMSGFDSSDDEENEELDLSPFIVNWLDMSCVGCAEQLGISGLPGCRFKDTWRSLETDIVTLKGMEITEVFVLCTKGELNKYRVPYLLHEYTGADFNVHHHPFPDGQAPSVAGMVKMLEELKVNLMQGRKTLLHCFGGLGRSCVVAACLLMYMDESLDSESAIQRLRQLRGPGAVQSVKQYNFIHDFRKNLEEYEQGKEEASRSVSR